MEAVKNKLSNFSNMCRSSNELKFLLYFPIVLIYFEIIIKISIFKSLFNSGFINMILFSIPIGMVFYILSTSFKENTNRIITIIITAIITFIYGAQFVYYKVFSTFLSIYSFIGANQAMQFWNEILRVIFVNIIIIILIFLPMCVLLVWKNKYMVPAKTSRNIKIRVALTAIVIQNIAVFTVMASDFGELSSKFLYSETFIPDMSVNRFGLMTTTRLDFQHLMDSMAINTARNSKNSPNHNIEVTTKQAIAANSQTYNSDGEMGIIKTHQSANITKYNKFEIDFETLIQNEQNSEIVEMHEYFNSIEPSKQNEYTGLFKGKNLILITAEGFSPYAIDKKLTPTLYKMYEEGYKFTDFYTPIWGVSTSDGEYVACTGLIPKPGIWSFYTSAQNYMPFCMGNQTQKLGYKTYAYHNHYYDYYKRDVSHPNMGYTYKAVGSGLDIKDTWPESDLEMIDKTVDEYMKEQPFHTYYMTVSGHLQYNFTGNYISAKNKSEVEDLSYSENVKAYLACNIELDKAMQSLIQKLESAGIADDTLIAISPDHYPYGLTNDEISELAGHSIETNFELYKGVFLLWSKGIKPITIDEPCSSLDIIPTLSNLMGLEYDSRLLIGRDIMSTTEPLVIFSNRSWITDKARYNTLTRELTADSDASVDEEYRKRINAVVSNKFKYSAKILDTDYYGMIIK